MVDYIVVMMKCGFNSKIWQVTCAATASMINEAKHSF